MASPLGLFVSVNGVAATADEVKKWFDRILKDHKRWGSAFYIGNLALGEIVKKDANGSIVRCEELDWIKDYLAFFDNVFVGSLAPEEVTDTTHENPYSEGIKKPEIRLANINAAHDAANLFIKFLRENNIAIPIHWYISYEANLNNLMDFSIYESYKTYIRDLIANLSNVSFGSGLNPPEFLWSPYLTQAFNELSTTHIYPEMFITVMSN
jgi:hypothetical protein